MDFLKSLFEIRSYSFAPDFEESVATPAPPPCPSTMKRFSCFSLRSFGIVVAGFDIIVGLCTLALCSYYLWTDYVHVSYWPQDEVKILSPLSNFIAIVGEFFRTFGMNVRNEIQYLSCYLLQ